MDVLNKIHSAAYVVMIEQVKCHISEGDINYASLARVHLDTVQCLSEHLDDDFGVYTEIQTLYPDRAIEATKLVLINTLTKSENLEFISDVSNGLRLGLNPVKYFAREAIKEIEDSPELIKLRPLIRESALPIVLSAIDEMLTRGATKDDLLQALFNVYIYVHGSEASDESLKEPFENDISMCWEFGEIDGSIDTTTAKAGKVAGGVSGSIVGAKAGAIIGSVVPVFGTVVGAAVGGVAGGFLGKALGEEVARPDVNDENSMQRNQDIEEFVSDASKYMAETVEEAKDISKVLSKKASRFFASW